MPRAEGQPDHDVVVVGAGFAGLYALHRLHSDGHRVRGFEAGSGVGGTWFWNRYPGARCDVESFDYSYSFSAELQQEWTWSQRYAPQAEILAYLEHVADRFDLRRHISFETRVTSVVLDEGSGLWTVTTDRGRASTARYVVFASGSLSTTNVPSLPGLQSFTGRLLHTGNWPADEVDFSGRRVAVIGTGSSGVQAIPQIAAQAEHLHVLQRTANFSVPALNRPLDELTVAREKAGYEHRRELSRRSGGGTPHATYPKGTFEVDDDERRRVYETAWTERGALFAKAFPDQPVDRSANDLAVAFAHEKIRAAVRDPEVADRLLPRDHPVGAKRICVDSGYYETFNRDNVTLIDLRATPLESVTPGGLRTTEIEIEVEDLVLATGYDAMTGTLNRIDIRGRAGVALRQTWAAGPVTYLGLMVAGFPNAFIVTGPGSPSALANMVLGAEQHVDWIADLLAHLRAVGGGAVEATPEAQRDWVAHVNDLASRTLAGQARSWYNGANIAGKPSVFMPYPGGFATYAERCRRVAEEGYRGFRITGSS